LALPQIIFNWYVLPQQYSYWPRRKWLQSLATNYKYILTFKTSTNIPLKMSIPKWFVSSFKITQKNKRNIIAKK
jgi:hypothetical protein